MPNTGATFITTLKKAHLEWGTYRHTHTRGMVYGEGYLQIPISVARNLGIYNSNQPQAITTFNCSSVDGFLNNVIIKASGSTRAGDPYAKQFQGRGHLRLLGDWFHHIGATVGDRVEISWITPTDIIIEKI
jgi:hypothetical protein